MRVPCYLCFWIHATKILQQEFYHIVSATARCPSSHLNMSLHSAGLLYLVSVCPALGLCIALLGLLGSLVSTFVT